MPKRMHLLTACFLSIVSLSYSQSTLLIRDARPVKLHYKELSLFDKKPDPAFGWMDTIPYPRKEIGTASMAVTMWRTAYLIDEPTGQGHVILFAEEPFFRGTFRSMTRPFVNSILFNGVL